MIPRYTDVEQFFSINSEDGMITTTRPLDREAQAWHNISVSATEIGMYAYSHTQTHNQFSRDFKIIGTESDVYRHVGLSLNIPLSLDISYKHTDILLIIIVV